MDYFVDENINILQESTKNSRKFLNLASKKGGYHPILTLGASKDWPKRALLLPGMPKLHNFFSFNHIEYKSN